MARSHSSIEAISPKATPRTPAELETLRKMVINALGIKATDDKELAKIVTVEETAFEAVPEVKTSLTELAVSYSDMGKHAFAVVVAVGLFIVFARMLKKAKPYAGRPIHHNHVYLDEQVNCPPPQRDLPDLMLLQRYPEIVKLRDQVRDYYFLKLFSQPSLH